MNSIELILTFWRQHPALLYGLSFLLGFYIAFYSYLAVILPLSLMWLPFLIFLIIDIQYIKPLILSILFAISSWSYGIVYYTFPDLAEEGKRGTAYIDIESVSSQTTMFGKNWIYRCHLHNFQADEEKTSIARHIKCSLSLPQRPTLQRPPANQAYIIQGTLLQSDTGCYIFKVDKKQDWLAVKNSWNFAEWRFQAKQKLINWIQEILSHPKSAVFLAGLATGEFDDHALQADFARFGLQHIMAISGFHFAVIASILSVILRLFLSRQVGNICIILALTMYMLLLGNTASVLRAWTMISIALFGDYISRQGNALNSLGIALLIVLLIDPQLCQTIGFQLSFLATAAILLLHPPCHYLLTKILIKRPLSQMVRMNGLNQHGYCILSFFRQGVALAIAINLLVVPLTLYYFHQFSFMSLFYNLFFPLFVSLSLFLLLVGMFLSFISPFLGACIHFINNFYTRWILSLTSSLPHSVDVYYEVDSLSLDLVIGYLCLLLLGGIWLKMKMAGQRLEKQDWAFI